MLKTFEELKKNFKFSPQACHIDNWVFQMHYRVSTLIFLVACILVTSRQYIGEHIKCIADKGVAENVINTFCFFTTTFTVLSQYNETVVHLGHVAHPGVGPYGINSTEPIIHHTYYQWVPFVLFGQAIMFHLTHLLWKHFEGGRIKKLISGMEYAGFAFLDEDLKIKDSSVPSKAKKNKHIETVKDAFLKRIVINRSWGIWLIVCEILNLLNVILQIYITDEFLNNQFYRLGINVIDEGLESIVTPLDEVFPKVTKCTFHKYGPSGSIQLHDAMCVMALNIINEKIYIFLWFWFIFLFIITALGLIWRVLTIFLHARSTKFNQMVFANTCPGKLNPWDMLTVTHHCNFADWLFLKYLSKNMDGVVFKDLFVGLAEKLDEQKPLIKIDSDEESNIDTLKKSAKYE